MTRYRTNPRPRLRVEHLEPRDNPTATPWAAVADNWEPGTFEKWVPDPGGVEWFINSAEIDGTFRNVLVAGVGGGARVVVINQDGTAPEIDRVFFDPDGWRGGVGDVASIGSTLYVTPRTSTNNLPGPVYAKIDLTTGATSEHWIPGFDPAYRGGARIVTADVDWVPSPTGESPHPDKELVFIPGGTAETLPGQVFYIINSTDDTMRRAVQWGDPNARRLLEPVPASTGIQIRGSVNGDFIGVGMYLQPVGSVPDPNTHTVPRTIGVTWDGTGVVETTWDTTQRVGQSEYESVYGPSY